MHTELVDNRTHQQRVGFQPGQSGNPAGRPKGSRNKLGELFVRALQEDFTEHGPQVIEQVRRDHPAQYLKVIAAVIPKEFNIKDQTFSGVSDTEFAQFVEAVRSVLGVSGEDSPRVIEGTTAPQGEQTSDPIHGVHLPALPNSLVPQTNSGTAGACGVEGDRQADAVGPTSAWKE